MSDMRDVVGLDRSGLRAALTPYGAPAYAAEQMFRWLYARRVSSFAAMTDLKRDLRDSLAGDLTIGWPAVAERRTAADGTVRYVYALADGRRTESVFIPGDDGQATMCVSSQVGCPLACTFCVSGLEGVERNLTAAEIVGQVRAMLNDSGPLRRTNLVFMGMGEALLNLEALTEALSLLADPAGFAIALRRMTVSTAGHLTALARFATLPRRPRLAVSLNATTDEQRDELMPINRTWPLQELLAACRRFPLRRHERITFEYVLLAGINDHDDDLRRLPLLLRGIAAKVNLIPWNAASGLPFRAPADDRVERFARRLHEHGLLATVRRRRGADAGAACGQLALKRPSDPPAAVVP